MYLHNLFQACCKLNLNFLSLQFFDADSIIIGFYQLNKPFLPNFKCKHTKVLIAN